MSERSMNSETTRVLTEAMATAASSLPKRLCQGHLISNLMQKNIRLSSVQALQRLSQVRPDLDGSQHCLGPLLSQAETFGGGVAGDVLLDCFADEVVGTDRD